MKAMLRSLSLGELMKQARESQPRPWRISHSFGCSPSGFLDISVIGDGSPHSAEGLDPYAPLASLVETAHQLSSGFDGVISNPAKGQRETPPDVNLVLVFKTSLLWVAHFWDIRKGSMIW